MDAKEHTERQRELWSKGDWRQMTSRTQQVAEALVEAAGITANDKVLDVAAGVGNVAITAARRGATAVAADLSPMMVARGKERTAAEGIDIAWHEADMHDLPFADGTFDAVMCAFGVLFAADPEAAAAELFRVLRPRGRLGLANWIREGWQGRMTDLMARYLPPPEGRPDPFAWGDEDQVREWLGPHSSELRLQRQLAWAEFATVQDWWESSSTYSPMLVAAKEKLDDPTFAKLGEDMMNGVREWLEDGPTARWGTPYLLAIAVKK